MKRGAAILLALALAAPAQEKAPQPTLGSTTVEVLRARLRLWFAARAAREAERQPESRPLRRVDEVAAQRAFLAEWRRQGGDQLLASAADLQAIFAGAFHEPLAELPASLHGEDAAVFVPAGYDPDLAHRTVLVLHTVSEPARAAGEHSDYFARTWEASGVAADSIFVLPTLPQELELDPPGGSLLTEAPDREVQRNTAAFQALFGRVHGQLHLDLDRLILDCGPGTCGLGLRLAAHFPSRFAAVILREPVEVPGLRLRSLTGLPVALLADVRTREACESLQLALDELQPGSCRIIEGFGGLASGSEGREALQQFVLQPRRQLARPQVVLEPNRDEWQKGYWLALSGCTPITAGGDATGPWAEAEADRIANRITVLCQGVGELTFQLDDRLVDLERPITFVINGVAHVERRQRSLWHLCEQVFKLRDPTLLFTTAVTLAVPERR